MRHSGLTGVLTSTWDSRRCRAHHRPHDRGIPSWLPSASERREDPFSRALGGVIEGGARRSCAAGARNMSHCQPHIKPLFCRCFRGVAIQNRRGGWYNREATFRPSKDMGTGGSTFWYYHPFLGKDHRSAYSVSWRCYRVAELKYNKTKDETPGSTRESRI